MNDSQSIRIAYLEKEMEELKDDVRNLRSLRDQLLGMSAAARWLYRLIAVLVSAGVIDGIIHFIQWLNQPRR